jgi:regulator of extracellular matrix RemA (YlzA/DUF370 family)
LTLIPIGYGNVVVAQRVVAIIAPDSSPVKRLREEAQGAGKLVDATHGRRTRAILITDSDHVILSALQPETISQRLHPSPDVLPAPEEGPDTEGKWRKKK